MGQPSWFKMCSRRFVLERTKGDPRNLLAVQANIDSASGGLSCAGVQHK